LSSLCVTVKDESDAEIDDDEGSASDTSIAHTTTNPVEGEAGSGVYPDQTRRVRCAGFKPNARYSTIKGRRLQKLELARCAPDVALAAMDETWILDQVMRRRVIER
jgi:hypothetical protein